jgi:IS30 family transposase
MLDWSPEQVSGWLKTQYPRDESMRVSHETIYRSLFIQARGALKKELGTSSVQAPHSPLAARSCQRTVTRSNRRCHLYSRKTRGNPGPRCPR